MNAFLVDWNKIEVIIKDEKKVYMDLSFHLYSKANDTITFSITNKIYEDNSWKYTLTLDNEYPFGQEVIIEANGNLRTFINNKKAIDFSDFDKRFSEDKELGSIYNKKSTIFRVWAPLATSVTLKIIDSKKIINYHSMIRLDNGTYEISLKGNYDSCLYHFLVTNNDDTVETNDPYAIGTSLNSVYSVVIDKTKLLKEKNVVSKTSTDNLLNAIIYETNIRDFTEDKNSNIASKGKYLGMVEPNCKTSGGNPAGLDYLKYLGITHVQLNPVTDFHGVDDIDYKKSYNWGYDILSHFALEGSYSSNPNDPYSRLFEFKRMINELHKNNICVILDVVFNHIYKYESSTYEACVPGYFFRRKGNEELYNASGCGNDFASERYMARRVILDSLKYFITYFDIDGFRFDLMGLLDIETINKAYYECKKIKNNILFYGEGWKMYSGYDVNSLANIENADKLPNVGFFNDMYRDIIKGPNFKDKIAVKGFANGDINYRYGFDFVFSGSVLDHSYTHRFTNPSQSINYVECHDNNTLFDKLTHSNKEETAEELIERCKLANNILLYSLGVAFIHSGQEIGASKFGCENSYNKVDINKFSYRLLDERFSLAECLKANIANRKNLRLYKEENASIIEDSLKIELIDSNLIKLNNKIDQCLYLINVENKTKNIELNTYYSLTINNNFSSIKNLTVSPISFTILYNI